MKATGIVRRIDDLGRVVIPKEIRRNLRIREETPWKYTSTGREVILKKYSSIAELGSLFRNNGFTFEATGITPLSVIETS